MANRVIVLEKRDTNRYNVAFWLNVPAARQPFYARLQSTFISSYKDVSPSETLALQNGSITEVIEDIARPSAANNAQVKSHLEARLTALQADVDAYNPWAIYGTRFDGISTWTNGSIA